MGNKIAIKSFINSENKKLGINLSKDANIENFIE